MAASTSSHNQTSHATKWDVFLSFRGVDTRDSFTDFLYHSLDRAGIRTFRDDPELRSGEVISEALLQAIQESKIYVVVFSENYASSRWCLDELVEIIKCYGSMQRLVIPVFYFIQPSIVKYQTGSFNEAFRRHENHFHGDRLDKWRVTLEEVGNFSGYPVRENTSQADIINKIVNRVSHEVKPKTLNVAKYVVGLESRINDIATFFRNDTKSVIRIGIYGMGGIGKTTLAKAVYNENYHRFQGSCFLENVREASETKKGITCLQQKLITDVLGCKNITIDNADHGIELIKARTSSTKVLLVIDDLDNASSLDYLVGTFALGSTIIITTRDEDLLDSISVVAKYKVNELGDADSRQLFCQHAFEGDDGITCTFSKLSKNILKRAGGIPLALKICGSTLRNKDEEGWRWYIDKLRRDSISDVEKILLLSFDALKSVDTMLQHIFLAIACFFIGSNEEEVIKILETCYTSVSYYIDILKKRCLVTINYEELIMHDLLKDMGRKIACNNSPNVFEKHTRLWVSEDIQEELKENQSGNMISPKSMLVAKKGYNYTRTKREVQKPGEAGAPHNYQIDVRAAMKHVLPKREGGDEFVLPSLQGLKHLRTLEISYTADMTISPDLTGLSHLSHLNFKRCESLEEVHVSIGNLAGLVFLSIRGCKNLKSLPDSICNLRALKCLYIGHCSNLKEIPMNLGNIKSLEELNAEWLSICELPPSIGRLSKLIKLNLSFCGNLKTLPDSICNLRSLEMLDISWCSRLKVLPKAFGNLNSLVELKVETLPTVSKSLLFKHFT